MDAQHYTAHPTATIDEGANIGEGTCIWHYSHVMGGAVIGKACSLGQNVFVARTVVIGDGAKIQNNVSLYDGVICEAEVFIGPSAVFTNVINPRSAISRRDQFLQTRVCRGATIGANATIVCGVVLGEFAFIGAGSVVTRDVAAYELVLGNPARHHGWRSEWGQALNFDAVGMATCSESGERYQLSQGQVSKLAPSMP